MAEEYQTYIARKPCGCLSMAVVDMPQYAKATAREVAKAIRLGETVERVPTELVRTMAWKCAEHTTKMSS